MVGSASNIEEKIPSEMEAALRYTLHALLTLFTPFTDYSHCFTVLKNITVACMPIYIGTLLESRMG